MLSSRFLFLQANVWILITFEYVRDISFKTLKQITIRDNPFISFDYVIDAIEIAFLSNLSNLEPFGGVPGNSRTQNFGYKSVMFLKKRSLGRKIMSHKFGSGDAWINTRAE
jgi:hypothetical protein